MENKELKQTSIDWLVAEIQKLDIQITMDSKLKLMTAIEVAKEMHKEEHGNTWDKAIEKHKDRGHVIARSYVDFDDYYNEQFKK